jgi:hypothetical protein
VLRPELRSNRPNGSGTNKIVRSRAAITCSIQRSKVHVQTGDCCDDSAFALGGRQPVFAQERGYHARVYTMELTNLSRGSSVRMTEYLIAARVPIILWTRLAVMPAEVVFDAIEAELERRDVGR